MSKENDNNKPHITKTIDKILMGAVIGGAIGSVLGLTIAPKKGTETRQEIKKGATSIFSKLKKLLKKKETGTTAEVEFITRQAVDKSAQILKHVDQNDRQEDLRQIPHEK